MSLDKWAANHRSPLSPAHPPQEDVLLGVEDYVSTLGLHWSPSLDAFRYKAQVPKGNYSITKRSILSETARLYDPLG